MGLLERTRYLLSGAVEARLARGEDTGAVLLELESLRIEIEGWRRDLLRERDQVEADRQGQDSEILRLEKLVRTALHEEDERTARTQIARKREAVTIRSALVARRGRLEGRFERLERDLGSLAASIAEIRRRRSGRSGE